MDARWALPLVAGLSAAIGLGLIGAGVLILPKLDAAGPKHFVRWLQALGLLVFVLCGWTHLHMAYHTWTGTAVTTGKPVADGIVDPVLVVSYVALAVVSVAFLICTLTAVSIRVFDRTYYREVLERRLAEIARECGEAP